MSVTASDSASLGPFEAARSLSYRAPLPRFLRIRQTFGDQQVNDVPAATAEALEPLRYRVRPGMSVALTAGSRGIHDMPAVVRAAGEWLRSAGAVPFVVPAMGSHGGATADGQTAVLHGLGMTEQTLGMPIRATMDTVDLGTVPGGPHVRLDRHAAEADGLLVINRIKAHTDFKSDVESGLAKITAIGLGKQHGAEGIHRFGPAQLGTWIPLVARRIVGTGRVLGGIAIVENAHHRAAVIELILPDGIAGAHEKRLLALANELMGRLPFDDLDVAVIDAMGKDKSGVGIDPNVIGRLMIRGSAEFERPRIANIVVLDVSAGSHGNAMGMGLADFVPFRVLEKLDLRSCYINAVTGGLGGPQRAQIPISLPTDRDAIAAAVLTCGNPDPLACRIVRMRDTLHLRDLLVSEPLAEETERHPKLEVLGPPAPLRFASDGTVAQWMHA